ncbi:MAG: hypothetical protein GVY09_14280 [Gammaproteobacteria bacterium]|nr:hypothetical protein [Gammaproteobacteria bacterium]
MKRTIRRNGIDLVRLRPLRKRAAPVGLRPPVGMGFRSVAGSCTATGGVDADPRRQVDGEACLRRQLGFKHAPAGVRLERRSGAHDG